MKLLNEHIDKEVLSSLPTCSITGKIVVVDKPGDVAAAVADLWQSKVIGFDTETRPSFTKGVQHSVCLLQLATESTCYLFRLKLIGESAELKALLESGEHVKIGLSVHDDFRSLNRWMEVYPQNFIELQKYVKAYGVEDMSLQKIYAIIFGEKISKRQQLSNWEAETLSEAQQAYAAIDAWACRKIYYTLREKR